jgi:hypothetical protein
MKLSVVVTEDDIADGMPRYSKSCPVSLAASRAAGRPVIVGESIKFIVGTGEEAHLEPFVRQWIKKFDEGGEVSPFGFEIELK